MGFGTIGGANPDDITLNKTLAGALQIKPNLTYPAGDGSQLTNMSGNKAKGILPTDATGGWDTAPTNLSNITDDNYATACGTASKNYGSVTTGAEYIRYIKIDLGALKNISNVTLNAVSSKSGAQANMIETFFTLEVSTDDSAYSLLFDGDGIANNTSNFINAACARQVRYIRIGCVAKGTTSGSGTDIGNFTIYECQAISPSSG